MANNIVKNIIKHIVLVTKHKWLVFKFSIKLGIPFRGLMHDLSKFSYTEFWESAKYYNGERSPITDCKKEKGYSLSWLHHKGRNKHHDWYWVDLDAPEVAPVIPYKYVVEMICDKLSASITYNGKNWTNGIEKIITKQNVKSLYKKYCIDDTTKYKYEFHGEWKEFKQ